MTALDAGVIALLLVIAAGGYAQGFIRGLTRTAALVGIAALTATLSAGTIISHDVRTAVLQALALFGGVFCVVAAITWVVNRVIPGRVHASRVNKVLGVVPALVQGMIVVALLLGFVHRVALEQETQRYLERGVVTGRLIQPFTWLERTLAGVQ